MRRLAAVVVGMALWGAPVVAQDKAAAPSPQQHERVTVVQEDDKVVFRKKTMVDFTDAAIEGELTKPEGSYVLNRKKTHFKSLIKVRDDFNPELQKSIDNL
jgi:hypothetical protein